MAPDPALVQLLQESADRAVKAVETLRAELVADRTRDDERLAALEREVRVLRRCLTDGDGDQAVAKPARLGIDAKTVLGAILTLATTGALPALVVYLITGGP